MKHETIEEFLARGGKIQQIEAVKPKDNGITVKSTSKIPNIPIDITMGEHFFAEHVTRVKKERKFMGDINMLPPKLVEFMKERGKL